MTKKLDEAYGTISTQKSQMNKQQEDLVMSQQMKQEPEQNMEAAAPGGADLGMSPMTYMLIGITIGSIASVILVAYMNKKAALAKLAKRKLKGTSRPSSGSPLNSLDEEKSA